MTYLAPIRPKELIPLNTSPYFLVDIQEKYIRFIDSDSPAEAEPISLGETYDAEGDAISFSLECKNCGEEEYFTFVEAKSIIEVSKKIPEGSYFFKIELADDSKDDPKKKQYEFTVIVKPPIVFKVEEIFEEVPDSLYNVTEATIGVEVEKEIPTFKIVSLNYLGELKISFSQKMLLI